MFNGCVSRIALAFKDPKNYGEYTPYILAESSRRYQDALDDLTIQVLDVKWLLEQKLAENKARRESERKAKESASAAAAANTPSKRKHDGVGESPETPSKRPKTAEQPSPAQNGQLQANNPQPQRKSTPQPETITIDDPEPEKPAPVENTKQSAPEPAQQPDQTFDADDFARPSAQGTPAMTEEAADMFDLSMFPTNDQNNDTSSANGNDVDMNFEFDNAFIQEPIQPDTTTNNTNDVQQSQQEAQNQNDNQASLGSMLPGLEQYANMQAQPDDMNAGLGISQDANNAANDNQFNYGSGPNMFDEYLGGDTMNVGDGGDYSGDIEIQQDLDFDDLFGDN